VVVALSGGSDSVALTLLLRDLSEHAGFSLVAVAHLNHELRPSSDRDEQFCREFAAEQGLAIQISRGGVKSYAEECGASIEEAARKVRYSYLNQVAVALGADRVAVGHTRDDQAETLLMKLIRGAGQSGLAGIYPVRGRIVRPLLDVSRVELRTWLTAKGQRWVDDETNEDIENPRNRIRINVLPELERALGGDPRPPIARAAGLLREDGEWLDAEARREFDALVQIAPGEARVGLEPLKGLPGPIGRRVIRTALQHVGPGREIGQEHVQAVLDVADGLVGAADVPGGRAEVAGHELVLLTRKVAPK
jgi:tRNA(Ile)-lysidine synthase